MTNLQYKFIDMLDEFGYDVFNLKMIAETGYFSGSEITSVLKSLTKTGMINKVEQGKYVRSSFSDEKVIGNFLAPDGGIAYWTALNNHGLTEQFANVIFVQTAKRRGEVIFKNLRYKFVTVNKRKLFGYQNIGFGNHKYRITDLEKTIVDSFDLPQYSGWYHETIKAFYRANLNALKLKRYCKIMDNFSVTKRLAFLCELLQKPDMDKFIEYTQKSIINNGYSLFETGGEKTGNYNKRWKLVINIPIEEIIEIANS